LLDFTPLVEFAEKLADNFDIQLTVWI